VKLRPLSIKLKLFLPISAIITSVVIVLAIWLYSDSVKTFEEQLKNSLKLEVRTISKMFDREQKLKIENVKKSIKLALKIFNESSFYIVNNVLEFIAENQLTGEKTSVYLNPWYLNGYLINDNNSFVDSIQNLIGGTVTIFQKTDSGYVRISTNVLKKDGSRAIGTFLPNDSPVVQTIEKGETYLGRAYVVDDWYITAYEPIICQDSIVGMLYVGQKEKDLEELKVILRDLTIGKTGYPFVLDDNGYMIIHPNREGEFWGDSTIFYQIRDKKEGTFEYMIDGKEKLMSFLYYEDLNIYIAASVVLKEESKELRQDTIRNSIITAIITISFLLIFIYIFTTDKIYRFFTALEQSKRNLSDAQQALRESEERFQELFDSTVDDIFVTNINEEIVEVNKAACNTLGYTKEELLKMKMSDIKSSQFKSSVTKNRKIIFKKGSYQFESEHLTKDGRIITVEFVSRLITYNNEKQILSVVRNITRRRMEERQVLSAVIQAEERERQRFAKDMHDGLGPLLSTIKLYVNELKSMTSSQKEREEMVNYSNELIDEAVVATRNISNNLMPSVINEYGLVKALESFCDKVNKVNKINIKFETENLEERLDQNLELIFFRVISELINNTIKHAKAKNIFILLVKNEDKLDLYFKDDGIGFNVEEILTTKNLGMGLKNIISRVKSINGKYSFNSIPKEGFTIKIEVSI